MAFSLLNFFKRKKDEEVAPEAAPAPAPVEKRNGERLSKTVMPSGRTVMPSSESNGNGSAAAHSAPAVEAPAAPVPAPVVPRTVSFAPSMPRTEEIPPAVALALEPRVERAISVDLVDVVAQMPPGFVRPLENNDTERRVLLKAADLERGMSNGRPTVAVASIYEQVPDIFVRPVEATDTTQVALPFSKVLEQFSALQVRSDQFREQAVPHVETPFLKVTLEDDERFGTKTEVLLGGQIDSVRVEPATAESIAAAEPEPAALERVATAAPKPVAFSLHSAPAPQAKTNGATQSAPAEPATPAPTRIPFKLTPNGTGVPATERVPASSGPPVPTSLDTPPAAPKRIAFKLTPGGDAGAASSATEPEPTPAPVKLATPTVLPNPQVADASCISLLLRPILEMLPPMQLIGEPGDVPENTRIEVPFNLVEPQLVSGRVQITPEEFAAALPEEHRAMFNLDSAAPVSLPLHEVLKNLPAASLRMRDDQEEQEQGANFATPFSAKAEEDAKRFNVPSAPVPKPSIGAPVVLPPPAVEEEEEKTPAAAAVVEPVSADEGQTEEPRPAFGNDERLDAKAAVADIGQLPGVKGCAIVFDDGLSLAGNLPEEYQADGITAVVPSLMQRLQNHTPETKLGDLRWLTVSCTEAAITFFTYDKLCLAALHAEPELAAETRERLAQVVQELSKTYSHPA